MITNADCTIYNKKLRPDGKNYTYYRTHLKDVFWMENQGLQTEKTGFTTADSLTLLIPVLVNTDKAYQSPKQFDGSGWTLQKGDVVVKGMIDDEIHSISDLEKKYDHVHLITTIDENLYGSLELRHFKVGGR